MKLLDLDQGHYGFRPGNAHLQELLKSREQSCPVPVAAQRYFANYEGVDDDLLIFEHLHELFYGIAEVVNPDRAVGEDHRLIETTPWGCRGVGIASSHPRKFTRRFAGDECFQGMTDEG